MRRFFLRRLWRRRRVLFAGLSLLILLALLAPALGVLREALRWGGELLLTPGGRLAALNLALAVAGALSWRRWRRVRAEERARHLRRQVAAALGAAAWGEWEAALRRWRAVGRLVPASGSDAAWGLLARIEAGRAQYHLGRLDEAWRAVEGLSGRTLPPPLRGRWREVRALVYAAHPRLEPGPVRREVEAALAGRPTPALLRAALALADREGARERARELHRTLLQVVEGRDREVEGRRYRERAWRDARFLLARGEPARAAAVLAEAHALAGPGEATALALGDARLAAGDEEGALRAWAQVPGPEARRRAAARLAAGAPLARVLRAAPFAELFFDAARLELQAGRRATAWRHLAAGRALGADAVEGAVLAGDLAAAAGDEAAARRAYLDAARQLAGLSVGGRRSDRAVRNG